MCNKTRYTGNFELHTQNICTDFKSLRICKCLRACPHLQMRTCTPHTRRYTQPCTHAHANTRSTSFSGLLHSNTSFSCLHAFTLLIFFMPSRLFLVSHDFFLILLPPCIHRSSVNSLPTLVFPRTKSRFFLWCNRGSEVWGGVGNHSVTPPHTSSTCRPHTLVA